MRLKRLEKIIEEKGKISRNELEEISRRVFWNINFFIIYGLIYKIVRSLGSDKLVEIIKEACEEINTPASFLVKHGVLMWYSKNLQLDEIKKKIKEKNFSEIAKATLKLAIVNYCTLHPINYKDRQRIENILGIPHQKLLPGKK